MDLHESLTPESRLIKAAQIGNAKVVEHLLEWGADIHAYWDIALRGAAENGHTETVKLLLKHYTEEELKEMSENSIFSDAHKEITERLRTFRRIKSVIKHQDKNPGMDI